MNIRVISPAFQVALASLVVLSLSVSASAQKKKHIEQKTITTKDRWPLKLTYYKQQGKRDSPVVILLHSHKGDARVWTSGYADVLWNEGFAVIAIDLRKHGESKVETATGSSADIGDLKPNDYRQILSFDMEAVKKFILEEHTKQNLNMRKTGIVAPEMSAPIALNFAAIDWARIPYDDASIPSRRTPRGQDIRALVLISPEATVPGMNSVAAVRSLRDPAKNIAFLFCYGSKDKLDRGTTKRLYSQIKGKAKSAEERVYLQTYPYKLRGMDLIGKKLKIESDVKIFLKKFLLELEDEWVNRKSRLDR